MKTEDIIQKQDELINHLRRFIHTEIVEEGIILPDKHEWNDFINIDKSLRAELSSLKSMRDEKEDKPAIFPSKKDACAECSKGESIYDDPEEMQSKMLSRREYAKAAYDNGFLNCYDWISRIFQYPPQPQPGQFKKFSLLEETETVTSSDTIVQSQPGRGAEEIFHKFCNNLINDEYRIRDKRGFIKALEQYRTQSEGKDMYPKEFIEWLIENNVSYFKGGKSYHINNSKGQYKWGTFDELFNHWSSNHK